jgi:hypothetical protein
MGKVAPTIDCIREPKRFPPPLILGYWHESTSIEKSTRVEEQIDWAAKNNYLQVLTEYLLQLRSEHWLKNV